MYYIRLGSGRVTQRNFMSFGWGLVNVTQKYLIFARACGSIYVMERWGPTGGFLRYPTGHSQGMRIDVGDSEVLRNFNPNPHYNLTSCSSDCTMYAYVEVYCIIYFRGLNIISVFKKKNALIKSLSMQIESKHPRNMVKLHYL